ncbi:H-type small acid-soluble spore protein [Alkalihalobacillus hemicellulosilyticus]|uniref:Small, acid-soluble spore protein H n=1 Tax=Halalkalibacter hemicellulosilyticusJCM 9152 TaxID=1236971 RepID=W4QJA0_9BACI|nr:H-type small acid-soluble spore protein [Halalkalibacter hemicellulosilyticus]GAE31404.1 acid-soluble spore protein H [Halalkalibacter hemicellulosilyticusJCM 9152]
METERAQEISSSETMIPVMHNGQKIYIEHVDRSNGKATIHPIDNPEQKQSVAISELTED